MPQDLRNLALLGCQSADNVIGQKLRAFAQRGKRRLQFMRYLLQETVFLLLKIDELPPHPFEALTEVLQVLRPVHRDRRAEVAVAELADRGIDLPDRARNQYREADNQENDDRDQRKALPEHDTPRIIRGIAHRPDFAIDELAALGHDHLGTVCELDEPAYLRLQRSRPERRVR